MQSKIALIRKSFAEELSAVRTSAELEQIKVKFLGKKGPVQALMQALKDASSEERPKIGQEINLLKCELTEHIETRQAVLINKEENEALSTETLDATLPGRRRRLGNKHVITQTLENAIEILKEMGFSVQYGPDVDSDFYNFESLNFSPDHPARDMQDTFYLPNERLLRTHTSNVQVRVMEMEPPPIRVISPGKCFRNETITARHHVMFHQIEAFYIDKGVTFADLLATLDEFLEKLFHKDIETLYRPSYFPFVEPGLEVDVRCIACKGNGCPLCKHSGWLEVAGAGMIHPNVLKNGGIDPEVYSGFAWGFGIERLAQIKYNIQDIRLYTQNDLRFLAQFPST
jgi:phenylalanyl-tRNA synthetase alpha chain